MLAKQNIMQIYYFKQTHLTELTGSTQIVAQHYDLLRLNKQSK
jgi:hypothetical protein